MSYKQDIKRIGQESALVKKGYKLDGDTYYKNFKENRVEVSINLDEALLYINITDIRFNDKVNDISHKKVFSQQNMREYNKDYTTFQWWVANIKKHLPKAEKIAKTKYFEVTKGKWVG